MIAEDIAALWNFNDPPESERRFRAALETTIDGADRVEILTQIARALGLQRNFAEGHAVLDGAAAVEGAQANRPAILLPLERGRLFNSAGDRVTAVTFFKQALDRATISGESALAIDAAHMLGIAAPPEDQLAWNERALAMAEAATDERSRNWLGSLLNNIGWTYHDRGEFEIALDRFERAARWRRDKGQPVETRIADWAVARTLRSLGRFNEALVAQRRLAEEWEAVGESDSYVDEEIAECLLALGRAEEAKPHFARAHVALSSDSWLVANEPARIARLKELGSPAD